MYRESHLYLEDLWPDAKSMKIPEKFYLWGGCTIRKPLTLCFPTITVFSGPVQGNVNGLFYDASLRSARDLTMTIPDKLSTWYGLLLRTCCEELEAS